MAVNLPAAEVARALARVAQSLLLAEVAALDYPDPGRWTGVFSLPLLPVHRGPDAGGPVMARWPFLPPQVKSLDEARTWCAKTANCRAEEMFDKPTWRQAARSGRCLVPVLGYYDHQHRSKATRKDPVKVPYLIHSATEPVLWVGGLWQDWHDGPVVTLCTIEANSVCRWVHNSRPRQLLIVPPERHHDWLAGGGAETLEGLLAPRDDDGIVAEETPGPSGRWVEAGPPEPPGRPTGVLVRGQLDLF